MSPALRSLARTPWFSSALVAVLALMTALTASVFAVVDGTLFNPLPFRDSDRLFAVSGAHRLAPGAATGRVISGAEAEAWRSALPGAQFTVYYRGDRVVLGEGESVPAARVDAGFFDVMGLSPAMGEFGPDDFAATPPKIRPAIVTHGFWVRRLGGDASALGRVLAASDGSGIRVAGVLRADAILPDFATQVLTPFIPNVSSRGRSYTALIRLPRGVTAEEASNRLTAAAARDAAAAPAESALNLDEAARIRIRPYDQVSLTPIRDALTTGQRELAVASVAAAVVLILLACFNLTGLAVSRVRDRQNDLIIRRALGAGRMALLRLIAGEYAALMVAGLVTGVLIAPIAINATMQLMPASIRLIKAPALDVRAIVVSTIAAALTLGVVTLLAGRAAWRAGGSLASTSARTARSRPGRFVIAAQVALGLVVSVASGLIITGLFRVWGSDAGLKVDDTAVVRVSGARLGGKEIESLAADLRRLPGVRHAGGVNRPLLQLAFNGNDFDRPVGVPDLAAESMPVTAGFFEAAGLRALEGRLLTADEHSTGSGLLVVSQLVARTYWPGRSAIGQTLTRAGQTFEVVGVVGDSRIVSLDRGSNGTIFFPLTAQSSPGLSNVLVEFDQKRSSLPAIASWVASRCPGPCRVTNADMLEDAMANTIRPWRFRAWIFTAFGMSALVVVALGTLGLVLMTTARRSKEIGIRMALGSTRGGVIGMIVREQAVAVIAGLVAGGIVAAWGVRFVHAYLYETTMYDVTAWGVATAVLLLVTLASVLVPAHLSSRVNPVNVLRES